MQSARSEKSEQFSLPESSPPKTAVAESETSSSPSFEREKEQLVGQIHGNIERIIEEMEKLNNGLKGSSMMTAEFEKIGELWKSLYTTMVKPDRS